ncbi:MAG: MFS transporter [Bacteroidota bacterium]
MDLTIVYVGLSLILYFVILLGTSRLAIRKGFNGVLMFVVALVLPPIAVIISLFIIGRKNVAAESVTPFGNVINEITQPFIDLMHTSRALVGLNISYTLEGLTYFGVLGLLAIYFNDYIKLDDIRAGNMVGILTAGITLSMLFLGATVDWIGVRKALLYALSFMFVGRILLSVAPHLGAPGLWGGAHIYAMLGILGIVLGYGIYQPAAYAAVKKFTNENTAAMGYAMLYGLMNLGGYLPGLISPPVRRATSILGVFWVYVALTVAGIAVVYFIMTKKAVESAVKEASQGKVESEKEEDDELSKMTAKEKMKFYIKNFPLKDKRFLYFIFILIPVQTLFAHNWLTIPQYTSRAFNGFVQDNFEFFVNLNPILIFILAPMVAALTSKKNTYTMMIIGTFVMASPTFILALGPNFDTLVAYIIIMTIGEAMWQPRFLQWVAEIAPKNMTGIYMGIGQFPWFLTKVITSLYSGWFLMHYCPVDTPPSQMHTETMWLIYGFIAIMTPIGLLLARRWMIKGFKTKHEG